jgi:tetratricopeptide (TPR) repeat protein
MEGNMKNIHTLLSEIGVTVPDDKKADFDKAVTENYKTVADYDKQAGKLQKAQDDLESANDKIGELSEAVKGTEGAEQTIKDLQKKLGDYEEAEKTRKSEEEAAEADAQLTATIEEYYGSDSMKDKKFVNEFTRKSITDTLKAEMNKPENKGKGVSDLFSALTKEQDGIFKNPQDPINIPPTGMLRPDAAEESKIRAVMGLPPLKG